MKLAVLPLKLVVLTGVPLAHKVTLVILAGFPLPETDRTSCVMLTVDPLGFINTTCCTGTLLSPASWLELPGGLPPWAADTVTAVGVKVGVMVGVEVEVKVSVGVFVAWATVTVAPDTGKPLKRAAWPLFPAAPVRLKL